LGIQIWQKLAAPRNSLICWQVLGPVMEQIASFLLGPSLHCPCDRWNLRYLTISQKIWAFFWETLYPAFHKRKRRWWVPSIQFSSVGPANKRSSTYWNSVQPCWLAEKAFRLGANPVPKIVGEFLKPCGNWVQANCPFSLVLGLSHWKRKIGCPWGSR
jgi:hypothetical protein